MATPSLQETLLSRATSPGQPSIPSGMEAGPVMSGMMSSPDDSKISPDTAGYLGPEEGPFECEHCQFWQEPNACKVVAGPIAPDGCCNNFTKGSESTEPAGEG